MSVVVGFAGMTHLGLNSAAATAARGFRVIGYDADRARIDRLREGVLPVREPGLAELFAEHAARVEFSADPAALQACDIVYISADVPTDSEGRSDLSPILALIETAAAHLREDAVLVVLSQVKPGFTRAVRAVPASRLYYQVETLVFGRAVERAMHPERFIVGCADPQQTLPQAYRAVLETFGCPILPMRYESAELAKISINICLVATLSATNTLAEICETIGADWNEIAPALRLDKRIGQHAYLTPGLGIAGGNLERDLRTILGIAEERGGDCRVVAAWIAHADQRKDWCWRTLRERVLAGAPQSRIAVLGLAYKENTDSVKGSPALALLAHLQGADVRVYDPLVPGSVAPFATECTDSLSAATGADAVVLATPWPEFARLVPAELARVMRGRVLIDPYRLLDAAAVRAAGFEYHALGIAPALLEGSEGAR